MQHNILIINLSPRSKGTSAMLATLCGKALESKGVCSRVLPLYKHSEETDVLLNAVDEADTLFFVGPCYINTYPADTYALLELIAAHSEVHHGQLVYGFVQGGMPYVHTHESGLRSLQLFSKKCGFVYQGGYVMGLGAMADGKSLDNIPTGKKVQKSLDIIFDCIANGQPVSMDLCKGDQMRLPYIFAWLLSKYMCRSVKKKILATGADPTSESPYLSMDESLKPSIDVSPA